MLYKTDRGEYRLARLELPTLTQAFQQAASLKHNDQQACSYLGPQANEGDLWDLFADGFCANNLKDVELDGDDAATYKTIHSVSIGKKGRPK